MERPKWGSSGGPWSVEPARVPATCDVASVRRAEGLTQAAFAKRYGFSPSAVRDWEQGVRRPGAAARVLLALIEREPAAVRRVVGATLAPERAESERRAPANSENAADIGS